MKVLVIDDEAIARRMVEHTLREGGYEVVTATNGQQGLELLQQAECQLVVTDWEMPGMNGIDFCKAVRSGDFPHYVYVVMVTSRDRPVDTISGLTVGADDYVAKPFNPGELLMRVNTGRRIIGMESREMTIFALAKLAESRDPETGAHLERVRAYCRTLASQLQQNPAFKDAVDDTFVRLVYETSPLHDIGKVAIPDRILLKAGKLSDQEFDVMKTHTLHGAETLAATVAQFPNARFLQMAHEIALCHHEKYDGSGYPRGLSGDDIPLAGRIVALADVYDALTSKRVYKNAYSHEKARAIITDGSGKHFDPAIVDAFLEVEDEFVQIRRQYQDPDSVCDAIDNLEFDVPDCFELREEAVLSAGAIG